MLMARGDKRRFVMMLVFLGGLPLPILAVAIGAYMVTRGLFVEQDASSLLTSQLLLFATAVLVVGAGGFAIWRTVASLGRATEIETSGEAGSTRTAMTEPGGPLVNSVSRMLTTIERQASELDHVSQQLDEAHRELESTRARLRETSFVDDVTNLHNRRFLFVRLEEEVARYRRFGRPVSLVLVALDHTPLDRDAAGDFAGDEMLRHVAEILTKASRGADVVCRYGADVFAVLLVETAGADAHAYAERVNDILLASSFGHEPPVTASLGISTLSEGSGTTDDVLRGAEEALQTARRAATHRVAVSAWAEALPGRAMGQR